MLYAHRSLLGAKCSFKVDANSDFASLAYTIDHVEASRLRWMFQVDRPKDISLHDLGHRDNLVKEWLNNNTKLSFEDSVLEAMRKACFDTRSLF